MGDERPFLSEAAEWIATLHSGSVTEQERADCRQWRQADPRHERAYARAEALWHRFEPVVGQGHPEAGEVLGKVLGPVRRAGRGPMLAVAALLGLALVPLSSRELFTDYRAAVGEQRRITLPDGSALLLNSGAAVDLAYDDDERRVVLRRGDLLAEVAVDPERPFVVDTRLGTARALGTRYTVSLHEQSMNVVVTESSVEVCAEEPAPPAHRACVAAHAGQQARSDGRAVTSPESVDTRLATAWVERRLVADDRPLEQVLREIARYRPGLLRFDTDALADLRVSGVFPLDDTDRALTMLADYLPITVRTYTRWLTLVNPR